MKATYKVYAKTEITKMFDQFNIFFYICGLKKFWIADLKLPVKFVKIFDKLLVLSDILMPILMLSNFLAVFTQKDISPRQSADIKLLCFTLPVIYHHFYSLLYYRTEVRNILYHLAVILKEYYSDKNTEMQMVKNMKLYVGLYCFSSSSALVHRGVSSLLNVIMYDKTFNPFVAVWPDVNDSSPAGLAVRVVNYIAIWCYGLRSNGTYGMILVILMSLSYQFKDLQNYFNSLYHIFEDDNLSQVEKEQKFEEEFKRGIYLHALSLWCVRQCQHVCRTIFNVQLVFSMCILMAVMRPLVNSETFAEKLAHVPMIGVILIILAIIMWNSGNITFEAQCVANAMYASGWHNCCGMSSVRIRKLVVNAMLQAQQPVVLTGFGIIHMSYENYVKVVKTSYSVFSVFY